MKIIACEVSKEIEGCPKENAIDGDITTIWSSGAASTPPDCQWIEVILDHPMEKVTLYWMPEMLPSTGDVKVEFKLYNKGSEEIGLNTPAPYHCATKVWVYSTLHTYDPKSNPDITDWKVKRVRMTFISSPSWIALREITVQEPSDLHKTL